MRDDARPAGDADIAVCGNGAVESGEDCDDGDQITDVACTDHCTFTCGDGMVEAVLGETCDTGIAAGPGACPSSCDDGMACTADLVSGAGCTVTCAASPITVPVDGDGCCPAGANALTDNDCLCGNGVQDAGETCDTAIANGNGACPTTCSDGMSCTRDELVGMGTCTTACTFPPITTALDGDMCCPPGANANTDNDCVPQCNNTVVESGEQCDDGNAVPDDGCDMCQLNPPTAFRFSDLDLRDPHIFVDFIGCRDITDTPVAGYSVNNALQTSIQTDGADAGTFLDLSIVTLFRPLSQGAATSPLEIHFPSCTSPMLSTACARTPPVSPPIISTATNMTTGSCLSPVTGTLAPYSPVVTSPAPPCYVTDTFTITINFGGVPITLHDARIAATYDGVPATTTRDGLLMGFMSEADADTTIVPASTPLLGGKPLSSLLPGGTNNCAPRDDRDTFMGVRGWWFYLNFVAPRVTWSDN